MQIKQAHLQLRILHFPVKIKFENHFRYRVYPVADLGGGRWPNFSEASLAPLNFIFKGGALSFYNRYANQTSSFVTKDFAFSSRDKIRKPFPLSGLSSSGFRWGKMAELFRSVFGASKFYF